jgi:tetratricopeptide (TPR) repeat protein
VFHAPVPVVKSTHDDLLPSIVPNNASVVYAAVVERNLDIYKRAITGGAAIRLTTHSADDTDPELSPDGEQIVWTSQAEDVKGDIWVMDQNGRGKRRLTGRDTSDRGATWSPDGRVLYFTCRARGTEVERVEAIDLEEETRRTVVEGAWDPAVSNDGRYLVYVALDDRPQPRIFVRRLADGRVAALTDGAYIEGLPRFARGSHSNRILFSRWVDDQTGDGVANIDDAPSLWAVDFDETLFADGTPAPARPLTAGDGGEIFASVANDWLLFTTAGFGDLEVYALPADGIIDSDAGPEVILDAARAEENPAVRRLALRHLVATAPHLAASARYELARELAERGRPSDAIDELQRVIEVADDAELAGIARIEVERLRLFDKLRGTLTVREEGERRFARHRLAAVRDIAAEQPDSVRVQMRAAVTQAEIDFALGRRQQAIVALDTVAARDGVPAEDGARALDRLGEIYARMRSLDAVARISEITLRRYASERYYALSAANRWVETARSNVGTPAPAALEQIVRTQADLPMVAARAAVALAREQEAHGQEDVAVEQWKRIAREYTTEHAIQADALITLGEAAERQGQTAEAIGAYERVIAEFPGRAQLRGRALQGLTRIALTQARAEERRGERERARESYGRLLRNNREIVHAHRRFIALSAEVGGHERVLTQYQAAAAASPRDKYARYGYAYALAYSRPPPLAAIERELEAALALDPHLAAAHVTLGWVRELRHESDPRGGWMERAVASYETAWSLVDPGNEPELWAAAKLNHGNALMKLGKTDFAFQSYLERELSQIPFDNPVTELLFRQRFARTALREDALDVALDMASLGYDRSVSLRGRPRFDSFVALNGAIALATGSYGDAAMWFARARTTYEEKEDWGRVVPMLRGEALALEAVGRRDEALAAWNQLLAHLEAGREPEEMEYCWSSPALRLFGVWIPLRLPFLSFMETELAANPESITGAICGFSSEQENEIARHAASRLFGDRGDLVRARELDAGRVQLAERAIEDGLRGTRVRRELLYALHDSALLATRAGDSAAAADRWRAALPLARTLGGCDDLIVDPLTQGSVCTATGLQVRIWRDTTVILESVAHLWTAEPALRASPLLDEAQRTAAVGVEATATSAPEVSRRLSRWLALERLAAALAPPAAAGADAATRVESLLGELDAATARVDEALSHARIAGDTEVVQHLLHLGGHLAGPDQNSEPIAKSPPDWRLRFDRALWNRGPQVRGPDPDWLLAAVDAFEEEPDPSPAPERSMFLAEATMLLVVRGEVQRAWQLLERARLLDWHPPEARLGPLTGDWQALRQLRASPKRYREAVAGASPLLQAIAGAPASLAEVQASLGNRGVLLQVFAPAPGQVHFFLVDSSGVSHVPASSVREIPETLVAHLAEPGSTEAPRFYVDAGLLLEAPLEELLLRGTPLGSTYAAGEVLSATYLVAAWSARNISRDGVLALGTELPGAINIRAGDVSRESLARARGRALVHLALPGRFQQAQLRPPGYAQLQFGDRLDLDDFSSRRIDANLVVASSLPAGARPARALHQALLVAGVPSLLVGPLPAERAGQLLDSLHSQRLLDALKDGERLLGFHGLQFPERIAFATREYSRLDNAGKAAYLSARRTHDQGDWHRARRNYEAALDMLAYLGEPGPLAELSRSEDPAEVKLARTLEKTEVGKRIVLAQIFANLGDLDEAVALQDLVVESFVKAKQRKAAVTVLHLVGANLSKGGRHDDAVIRFERCVELAREAQVTVFEARCLLRLGSEQRALLDYPGAARYYQQAAVLFEKLGSREQIEARRLLGFLFESSLNDYPRALEQFQHALAAAERLGATAEVPALTLAIVRIFRNRGDYEEALTRALAARERLPAIPTTKQAATMKDKAVAAIYKQRADVSLEIAKTYWYRGNYRRALEHQTRGLELARAARDSFREIQAVSLAGLIALNQGELGRAERSIRAALHISRATDRDEEVAKQLNNLGTVLREAGRIPEAIELFREALAIDERLGSTEGRAYDLRNLAVALHRQGEQAEALERVTEALELSRSIGEQYNQLRSLFAAGEILETLGDPASQESYEEAAQLAQRAAVPEVEWRSLYALGRRARKGGDLELARQLFDEALAVAERLGRGQAGSSIEHNRDDLYADAIALAVAAGEPERAFRYIEQARSRDLLDVLASRTLELPSPEARAAMGSELRARESVVAARRAVRLGVRDAAEHLAAAEQAARAAADALRSSFPRLARTFIIDPVTSAQLQTVLPGGTVVLSFFVGRQKTTVIATDREGARSFTIGIEADALASRVRRLRESMRAFGAVDTDLAELAGWLLEPLARVLARARVVVVVPHGVLHYLPFAALPVAGEPLLRRVVVATAPSGSALYDQLREPARTPPQRIAVLAPADDLPFARLEAQAIAGEEALVGPAATEAAVRSLHADALDLAAHAHLDPRDPLASAIELHPAGGHDGRLEMREVFALSNLPPLITLSACDSAATEARGSEWLSLGGAFLTAGARTVVASQNRVSDLATAVVMKRFYRNVRRQHAGEALRSAALLAREYFPHPAHWSGFVIMGDYR